MDTNINAVLVGVGAMGKLFVPMLLDKGVTVVGAATRESHAGEDLGTVCGIDPLGVEVVRDVESLLASGRVDVAIVSVATYVADLEELLSTCLRHGVNVITTAEEVLYPWRTEPEVSERLDALGRAHDATLLGSGYQDFFWVNEVLGLAGTCHRIDRIVGETRFNADDYGPELVRDHYVGLDLAAFEDQTRGGEDRPSYMQVTADVLVAGLGLTLTSLTEQIVPTTAGTDIDCRALGTTVPAGDVTGKAYVVHVETAEGVTMDLQLAGRLYEPGELDVNCWSIEGHPDVSVENPAPATDVITCSSIVNRIPDVLAAPPGLTSVAQLPALRYRRKLTTTPGA